MISDFITPDDTRWLSSHERVAHDVYQTPEYLEVSSIYEGGSPMAFWAEDKNCTLLVPLLLKELPATLHAPVSWRDAVSPYGYPSLLISPETSMSELILLLDEFISAARELAIVSVFIRLHPLFEVPHVALEKYGRLVRHGQTVYIDLSRPLDELRKKTRSNHRRGIKKLQQQGFQVAIDDWQLLHEFANIYRSTMQRVEAEEFYFFDDDYFNMLKRKLSGHLHLCTILSPQGNLSAGCLFTTCGEIIQYHLGGTSREFLKEAPSKLMFDAIRTWGKNAGYRFFHLGGGLGAGEDSLFHFKAGFSDNRKDFYTYRIIADQNKYQDCVSRWREAHEPGGNSHDDFFPEYRKP
jgi:lipid II:glycine glycyltransferase (peptidoglycan interpeptide bridge formation enzyme)